MQSLFVDVFGISGQVKQWRFQKQYPKTSAVHQPYEAASIY